MLGLLVGFFLILTIISIIMHLRCDNVNTEFFMTACITSLIIFSVSALIPIIIISSENSYKEQITIYEKENETIKNEICFLIKEKIDSEIVFNEDSDITFLIASYPEIKVNDFVQTQINTYIQNKEDIKKLKINIASISTAKWWLYFGK